MACALAWQLPRDACSEVRRCVFWREPGGCRSVVCWTHSPCAMIANKTTGAGDNGYRQGIKATGHRVWVTKSDSWWAFGRGWSCCSRRFYWWRWRSSSCSTTGHEDAPITKWPNRVKKSKKRWTTALAILQKPSASSSRISAATNSFTAKSKTARSNCRQRSKTSSSPTKMAKLPIPPCPTCSIRSFRCLRI